MAFIGMQTCERCERASQSLIMSFFNTQMICPECKNIEKTHPDYQRAHDMEVAAVLRGDYNFPGIGLPDDLVVKKKTEGEEPG